MSAPLHFRSPPPLHRGDPVRIVAPAGPFDRTLFWKGAGWLAEHFRVHWSPTIFRQDGFLAGSVQERLDDLKQALASECRALVCARGGVGSAEVVARLPKEYVLDNPKWLVGFSDITALHCAYQHFGLMSLHAGNITSLGVGNHPFREAWLRAVLNPLRQQELNVEVLNPGSARGPLVGGNLAVLHDVCAAGDWLPPLGAILFLEDVGEPPYRIYRMLASLARRGLIKHLSGLAFGQLSASSPGRHRIDALEVCRRFSLEHGLPAAWGVPAGHDPTQNLPLTLGASAALLLPAQGAGVLQLNTPSAAAVA